MPILGSGQATTGSTASAEIWRRTGTTGKDLEQWEYEVTSSGRVRYVIDDEAAKSG